MRYRSDFELFTTALAAFAGGFVAGLLLAPHSGQKMRQLIAKKAKAQSRWMEHQLEGLQDQVNTLKDEVHAASQQVGDKVRTATNEVVDQVLPNLPDEADAWGVEGQDVVGDLRRMPRK